MMGLRPYLFLRRPALGPHRNDLLIQRAPPIPPTLHARRVVGDWVDCFLAFFVEAPALEAFACPRLGIMVSIFLVL